MRLRFQGPSVGSAVAVSVTQSGVTRSASVASWGALPVGIAMYRSNLGVAPETVIFVLDPGSGFAAQPPADPATNPYDERLWKLDAMWDFGDAAAPAFAGLTRLPAAHRDANRQFGHIVAHTFGPGTYNVAVSVRETATGLRGHGTVTLTVADAAAVFAGAKTVFVDTSGSFANAPAGAQTAASIPAAIAAAQSFGGDVRIMLENGQSHAFGNTGSAALNFNAIPGSLHLCARDLALTKPLLSWSGGTDTSYAMRAENFDPAGIKDFCLYGLALAGTWSQADETGAYFGGLTAGGSASVPRYVQVYRNSFSGFESPLSLGYDETRIVAIAENQVTNWRSYGMFLRKSVLALVGNEVAANPGHWAGNGTQEGAAIRVSGDHIGAVLQNQIYGRYGNALSGLYPMPNGTLRWGTNSVKGSRLNCQMNYFEGHRPTFSYNSGNPLDTPAGTLVARNILVAGFRGDTFGTERGATQFIQNIQIVPDLAYAAASTAGKGGGGFYPPAWFSHGFNPADANANNGLNPVVVSHNSCVSLQSAAQKTGPQLLLSRYNNTALTLVAENNWVHAPNWGGGGDAVAPLDGTEIAACYDSFGYLSVSQTALLDYWKIPAGTLSLYRIAATSPQAGAATSGFRPFWDFLGNERPAGAWAKGAIEPA